VLAEEVVAVTESRKTEVFVHGNGVPFMTNEPPLEVVRQVEACVADVQQARLDGQHKDRLTSAARYIASCSGVDEAVLVDAIVHGVGIKDAIRAVHDGLLTLTQGLTETKMDDEVIGDDDSAEAVVVDMRSWARSATADGDAPRKVEDMRPWAPWARSATAADELGATDVSTPAEGDGSALDDGDGSALDDGDGSALDGGDGSALDDGDGSALDGGDGSALDGGDGDGSGDTSPTEPDDQDGDTFRPRTNIV
jgi:hypothetical protein